MSTKLHHELFSSIQTKVNIWIIYTVYYTLPLPDSPHHTNLNFMLRGIWIKKILGDRFKKSTKKNMKISNNFFQGG